MPPREASCRHLKYLRSVSEKQLTPATPISSKRKASLAAPSLRCAPCNCGSKQDIEIDSQNDIIRNLKFPLNADDSQPDIDLSFREDSSHEEKFPLHAIPLMDFLALASEPVLAPMQDLLQRGLLKRWDPSKGKLLFISHQWLDWEHPDPGMLQFKEAVKFLSRILASTNSSDAMGNRSSTWTFGHGTNTVNVAELTNDLEHLWVWYDYLSVPQPHAARNTPEILPQVKADFPLAIMSIPFYVEQASYFMVLAPSLSHSKTSNLVDFQAWGRRGWCRLELFCRVLSQRGGPVMVLTSATEVSAFSFECDLRVAVDWRVGGLSSCHEFRTCFVVLKVSVMRREDFFIKFLAVGLGEYSCCSLNHKLPDRDIPCDKPFTTQILAKTLSVKLQRLLDEEDLDRFRFWLSCRNVLFATMPTSSIPDELQPEATAEAFTQRLRIGEKEAPAQYSVLRYAVMSNNLPVVRALLSSGGVHDLSDPLQEDDEVTLRLKGSTLVHAAAQCFEEGDETMLKLLHTHGADLREKDAIGGTVLHYAARLGRSKNILYVLNACAAGTSPAIDVEAGEAFGNTALHFAAMRTHETATFDALIEVGHACIVTTNTLGSAPLHMAAIFGNRLGLQSLLKHMKRLNIPGAIDQPKVPTTASGLAIVLTAEIQYRLGKRAPMTVMFGGDPGGTPLCNAARYGHKAICEMLVNAGANPKLVTAGGWTAAQQAFNAGHYELAKTLDPSLAAHDSACKAKKPFIECARWPKVARRIRRSFTKGLDPSMQVKLLRDCNQVFQDRNGALFSLAQSKMPALVTVDDKGITTEIELDPETIEAISGMTVANSTPRSRLAALNAILCALTRQWNSQRLMKVTKNQGNNYAKAFVKKLAEKFAKNVAERSQRKQRMVSQTKCFK